ncbi:MAG TPA: hypothetical protein VH541_03955 [Gaiellaceae bacterium]|jgi:hypothetical protein
MPMLHGCAFSGCDTFTLGTYCFEHELVLRAELEAERAQLAGRDEPELTDAPQAAG